MEPDVELNPRDLGELVADLLDKQQLIFFKRAVSGTYRNAEPAQSGRMVSLRVDVDGNRPQQRLSGDVFFRFSIWGIDITFYLESFVVESPVVGGGAAAMRSRGRRPSTASPDGRASPSRCTSRACGSSRTRRRRA